MNYLPAGTNFQDIPMLPKRSAYGEDPGRLVECPLCKGHGSWNLRLNAYGPGKHFQGGCNQCYGWGWVAADSQNATCIHEYRPATERQLKALGITLYMHDHYYVCAKCNQGYLTDSSD